MARRSEVEVLGPVGYPSAPPVDGRIHPRPGASLTGWPTSIGVLIAVSVAGLPIIGLWGLERGMPMRQQRSTPTVRLEVGATAAVLVYPDGYGIADIRRATPLIAENSAAADVRVAYCETPRSGKLAGTVEQVCTATRPVRAGRVILRPDGLLPVLVVTPRRVGYVRLRGVLLVRGESGVLKDETLGADVIVRAAK